MTRYGWDASNHDWPRGPMDLARARREGISLFTHKASEGTTFTDPYIDDAMSRAKSAGFPVVGAYHVLWPGDPVGQADFFLSVVEQSAPWWRQHPCFIFQTDAELFQEFKPYRQPTLAEIHAFSDRVVAKTGVPASRVPCYGPEWLYGNALAGLRYPLWASAYGGNQSGAFAAHAAKDTDPRWRPYSGKTPVVLQCGSNATIAGQAPADINVIRAATDADLQALFLGTPGDDMSAADVAAINKHIDDALAAFWATIGGDQKVDLTRLGNAVHDGPDDMAKLFAALTAQIGTVATKLGALTPQAFAAALAPLLLPALLSAVQSGQPITLAVLEQALTDVLGSLDNK